MVRDAPSAENWARAYVEAPDIFDAFCRAEDPDGRITRRLIALARLRERAVLEVGCGTGRYTREWAPHAASYVALERSAAMLALARRCCEGIPRRPAFVVGDARSLPLADSSVERILAGWLVLNLTPAARKTALGEMSRVLRPSGEAGVWLVENHWSGEFHELRGRSSEVEERRLRGLIDCWGFTLVDVIESELRFPSKDEACRVLGYLCGAAVGRKLRQRPVSSMTHHVVLLSRSWPD